jgi:hypothetical protein
MVLLPSEQRVRRRKGATLRLLKVFFRSASREDRILSTVALQDNGSSRSFVDEQTAKDLGVLLDLKFNNTSTLHGSRQGPSAELDLEISRDGTTWFRVSDVETYRNLRLPGPELRWTKFIKENPEFKEVDAEDVSFADVRLLLGAQLEEQLLPLDEPGCRIHKNGISAYKTQLGWTIGGCLDELVKHSTTSSISACVSPENTEWQAVQDGRASSHKGNTAQGSWMSRFTMFLVMATHLFFVCWIMAGAVFMGGCHREPTQTIACSPVWCVADQEGAQQMVIHHQAKWFIGGSKVPCSPIWEPPDTSDQYAWIPVSAAELWSTGSLRVPAPHQWTWACSLSSIYP